MRREGRGGEGRRGGKRGEGRGGEGGRGGEEGEGGRGGGDRGKRLDICTSTLHVKFDSHVLVM